jgi:hypothetical protein
VTDPLDAAVAGFVVERWISRSGSRGIAIANDDGGRRLISVLDAALDVADPGLAERRPWDAPLVGVRATTGGGQILVEVLPDGDPSTADPPPWEATAGDGVPPFAVELARRMAVAGDAGVPVGPLHPALVFVARAGELAATAQRVLRLAPAAGPEGRPPLFAAGYRTPAEVRGEPASASDDAFRLASLLWRWRHGAAPFGTGLAEVEGILAGRPAEEPVDAFDRLLVRAFSPTPPGRPSTTAIAAALDDPALSWRPARDTARTPPRP